jgi:2-polyprenyl-6-methoxyphenol hydroxylase-like FAD-dependent oxidoreductase
MSDAGKLDADVVVVGAGPVGTALAVDLALSGVRTIVLEARAAGDPPHPGTNLTNIRTMEHFRRWGVVEHVRAANPVGDDVARDVQFVTRGDGHMIVNLEGALQFDERMPFTSGAPHFGPQASIEAGLRARLGQLDACELRFDASFERFVSHDDYVEVVYRDGDGVERSVTGAYLVGADGARSRVRRQLGIRMEGRPRIQYGASWYVQSTEMRDLLAERFGSAAMVWFVNDDRTGAIVIAQNSDGRFQYYDGPLDPSVDGDDWERSRQALFRLLGREVDVEPIEGGGLWLNSLVPPTFQDGRVFLVGESCHLISTFGGFGMNTGVGDAADLGWKLAAAVLGWAGEELLASYDEERIPIVRWIRDLTEESTAHGGPKFWRAGMEERGPEGDALRAEIASQIVDAKQRELVSLGAQFGAAYRESPITVPDGTEPPHASFGQFEPSASPGARVPHVWLDGDRSLFDEVALCGFTLLVLDATAKTAPLERAARERGVPLKLLPVDSAELAAQCAAALVLVRPDHHVAWRGRSLPADAGLVLDVARGVPGARAAAVAAAEGASAPAGAAAAQPA